MNKKITYIFIIVIVVVGVSIILFKSPLNFFSDPFGSPPKGAAFNCGPEDRYKFNVTISSKEDFVNFVKTQKINNWTRLDNFKDNLTGEVNWNKVLYSVKIYKIGGREIYSIDYTPDGCSTAQKFTLRITNNGYVSVYGCCGE
jgi:hypothetical protein